MSDSKVGANYLAPADTPSNEIDVQALYDWMNAEQIDETSSRAASTEYTNSNGYPMPIRIVANVTAAAAAYIGVSIDGDEFPFRNDAGNSSSKWALELTVPAGSTYQVSTLSNCTIYEWYEVK